MSKLRRVKIEGFKSLVSVYLDLEHQGCTSLVGANNSGKSSFLRALSAFFSTAPIITEDEKTRGHTGNPAVECTFEFTKDNSGGRGGLLGQPVKAGQTFDVRRELFPVAPYAVYGTDRKSLGTFTEISQLVDAVPAFLPIRATTFAYQQTIASAQLDPAMQILINAFQLNLQSVTVARLQSDENAKKQVHELSGQIWHDGDIGSFAYVSAGGKVTFTIADSKGRYFALSDMGEGIQRALSIALQIHDLRTRLGDRDLILTIDEPENSLHPRAQRDLFLFLNNIQNAQVICATHSPCMIDARMPTAIRTVSRNRETGESTILSRKHIADNLETVRLALGILPTDSLSFGFINIVVEGAIDLLVYPIWAETLLKAGRVDLDIALVRFLNGSGSSVPVYFDVAISTGMPTLALLDNDAAGRVRRKDFPVG